MNSFCYGKMLREKHNDSWEGCVCEVCECLSDKAFCEE